MFAILHLLAIFVANYFKSRHRLEVENVFLRHQLNIALRRVPGRLQLRKILVSMCTPFCLTTLPGTRHSRPMMTSVEVKSFAEIELRQGARVIYSTKQD